MSHTENKSHLKIRFILYFSLLLCGTITHAQQKLLEGKITNSKDVEGIHVLNTSSRFNSVTNANGFFSITVKPLDTLVISSVAYVPKQVVVSQDIYDDGYISIRLEDLINELSEVYLGRKLTGNLEYDIKNIEILDTLDFDDVGIPGFKGKPEEKIVPIVPGIGLLTAVDVEALYKHLSGYYKKLRMQRKWEAENVIVAKMIHYYTPNFFEQAYEIPEERLYDFLWFCIETSEVQENFRKENYNLVLETFAAKGKEYTLRLSEKKE